jgi:hypothetical protein
MVSGVAISSIIGFSAREAVRPPHLLGRVSATTRTAPWGVIPIAAIAAGWLAEAIGIRAAHWIVAGVYFAEPLPSLPAHAPAVPMPAVNQFCCVTVMSPTIAGLEPELNHSGWRHCRYTRPPWSR